MWNVSSEAWTHVQVRRSPLTGREELVVVGGYTASLLAEMKPFTLDLETLYWRCWPGVKEGDSLPLPTPRQRMAAMRITHDWFLVSGGSPTSVRPSSVSLLMHLLSLQKISKSDLRSSFQHSSPP
jgi:hypothetical protein